MAIKLQKLNKRIDKEVKRLMDGLSSLLIVFSIVSVIFSLVVVPLLALLGAWELNEALLLYAFAIPSLFAILWAMSSMDIIKLKIELYKEARCSS